MNTKQGPTAGRRRRHHSTEFKAKVVEECTGRGVSMAAVALARAEREFAATLGGGEEVDWSHAGVGNESAAAGIPGTALGNGSAAAACGRRHLHRTAPWRHHRHDPLAGAGRRRLPE